MDGKISGTGTNAILMIRTAPKSLAAFCFIYFIIIFFFFSPEQKERNEKMNSLGIEIQETGGFDDRIVSCAELVQMISQQTSSRALPSPLVTVRFPSGKKKLTNGWEILRPVEVMVLLFIFYFYFSTSLESNKI